MEFIGQSLLYNYVYEGLFVSMSLFLQENKIHKAKSILQLCTHLRER